MKRLVLGEHARVQMVQCQLTHELKGRISFSSNKFPLCKSIHTFIEHTVIQQHQQFTMVTRFGHLFSHNQTMHYLELKKNGTIDLM